ncbi:MAG: hypothetical protein ACPGXY_00855 [Alphaproteobacteria bacterium]
MKNLFIAIVCLLGCVLAANPSLSSEEKTDWKFGDAPTHVRMSVEKYHQLREATENVPKLVLENKRLERELSSSTEELSFYRGQYEQLYYAVLDGRVMQTEDGKLQIVPRQQQNQQYVYSGYEYQGGAAQAQQEHEKPVDWNYAQQQAGSVPSTSSYYTSNVFTPTPMRLEVNPLVSVDTQVYNNPYGNNPQYPYK